MAPFAAALYVKGDRVVVLWSQGNRVDEHYVDLARAAARVFDRFICTEPADPRGRVPGKIAGRIGKGLREAGVSDDRIAILPNEDAAVSLALSSARPGDFVLICCKDYDRA